MYFTNLNLKATIAPGEKENRFWTKSLCVCRIWISRLPNGHVRLARIVQRVLSIGSYIETHDEKRFELNGNSRIVFALLRSDGVGTHHLYFAEAKSRTTDGGRRKNYVRGNRQHSATVPSSRYNIVVLFRDVYSRSSRENDRRRRS